jgi:hypothetical protein
LPGWRSFVCWSPHWKSANTYTYATK